MINEDRNDFIRLLDGELSIIQNLDLINLMKKKTVSMCFSHNYL